MLVDQREIDHIVQHLIYQFELVYQFSANNGKLYLVVYNPKLPQLD